MKYLYLFLFLIIPNLNFAQKTKPVEEYFRGSKQIKNSYSIIKRSGKVKHGAFKAYYFNGNLKTSGFYHHGKKDSTWITYTDRGAIKHKAQYMRGKKTGVWVSFVENGLIAKQYDHDQKKELPSMINFQGLFKFPDSAQKDGVDGIVTGILFFDGDCEIVEIEFEDTPLEVFRVATREGLKRMIRLSKKYNIPIKDCEDGQTIFKVNFKLQ